MDNNKCEKFEFYIRCPKCKNQENLNEIYKEHIDNLSKVIDDWCKPYKNRFFIKSEYYNSRHIRDVYCSTYEGSKFVKSELEKITFEKFKSGDTVQIYKEVKNKYLTVKFKFGKDSYKSLKYKYVFYKLLPVEEFDMDYLYTYGNKQEMFKTFFNNRNKEDERYETLSDEAKWDFEFGKQFMKVYEEEKINKINNLIIEEMVKDLQEKEKEKKIAESNIEKNPINLNKNILNGNLK